MSQIRDYTENAHTANYNLSEGESGTFHSNRGASGTITIFLPENASMGVWYRIYLGTAQELRIDPGDNGHILHINQSAGAAGKYLWADAAAESMTLVANGFNEWYKIDQAGIWGIQL